MEERGLSRRSALKYISILTASVAGREFLATWLPASTVHADTGPNGLVTMPGMHHAGPAASPASQYVPQFFKPAEFVTVETLTEMIIPTDDKPGAREAQVANYIDFVVFSASEFKPFLQREWIDGPAWIESESQKQFGRSFHDATGAERERLLTEMSVPEHDRSAYHDGFAFFRLVKDMTVEGFYTSRVGLIDVLEYQGLTYLSEFPGCTHPEHQT